MGSVAGYSGQQQVSWFSFWGGRVLFTPGLSDIQRSWPAGRQTAFYAVCSPKCLSPNDLNSLPYISSAGKRGKPPWLAAPGSTFTIPNRGITYRRSSRRPERLSRGNHHQRAQQKDRGGGAQHRSHQAQSGQPLPVGIRLPHAHLQRQSDVPVFP